MTTHALHGNIFSRMWRNLHSRFRFKYVLPRVRRAELEGVLLDISQLSPIMKNNILAGRYEVQERILAAKVLSPRDVVLELGGAIGFIGLFCRKVLGVSHHLSVEANPETISQLKRNYQLNGLLPDVIHAAAAAQDGEMQLHVGNEFWENTVVAAAGSSRAITVPALSLASLANRLPEPPTALICDIEGGEQYLDYSQLPESVSKIIMELHPEVVGESVTAQLLSGLEELGFLCVAKEAGTVLLVRGVTKSSTPA